jgi:hypothetical protein
MIKKLFRGHVERVCDATCAASSDQRSISLWEFIGKAAFGPEAISATGER